MFGFKNYVFIVVGLAWILYGLLCSVIVWGLTGNILLLTRLVRRGRGRKGARDPYVNIARKFHKITNILSVIFGGVLCLIGLYGIINNIHGENDKDLQETGVWLRNHPLFNKDKKDTIQN
jgi:hypothetical protein